MSTSPDNGNLLHQIDYAGGPNTWNALPAFSHTYSYDNLNRLTGDSDSNGASRTMAYDQWGNMAATGGAIWSGLTPTSTSAFNSNNRLTSSSFNYDNAGNMTLFGTIGIAYDAENRQITTNDSSLHVSATYSYDGFGDRVAKTSSNGTSSVYVYDAFGRLAGEYATGYATPPCTTCYPTYDHLGSVRMVTDSSGNVKSLALFGSDSTRKAEAKKQAEAESLSKTRLEGSCWRGVTSMEVQTSFGTVPARSKLRCTPEVCWGETQELQKHWWETTESGSWTVQRVGTMATDTRVRPRVNARYGADYDRLPHEVSSRSHNE